MHTYSGIEVTPGEGVPSLGDIAVHLGRICRFAGAVREFWPVLLHSLAVWELVTSAKTPLMGPRFNLIALLHDASEAVLGDITRPFKTPDTKKIEDAIEEKIYRSLGIRPPSEWEVHIIKRFDDRILYGEVGTIGPMGLDTHYNIEGTRTKLEKDPYAESIVMAVYNAFPPEECINPEGRAVKFYIERVEEELDGLLRNGSNDPSDGEAREPQENNLQERSESR